MKRSTSSGRTSGPRSLISVCSPGGGVDDHEVGARIALDLGEVVEDGLLRQTLEDSRARAAARQPGGDHGAPEQLQGARDVDALAAGDRARLDRAVALPEPEVGHGDRAVDGGIEGDGEDHVSTPLTLRLAGPTTGDHRANRDRDRRDTAAGRAPRRQRAGPGARRRPAQRATRRSRREPSTARAAARGPTRSPSTVTIARPSRLPAPDRGRRGGGRRPPRRGSAAPRLTVACDRRDPRPAPRSRSPFGTRTCASVSSEPDHAASTR